MAALTFHILSASQQLFRLGRVFIKSGYSFKKCFIFIKAARKNYLFQRYLQEIHNLDCCDSIPRVNSLNITSKRNQMSSSIDYPELDDDIEIINGYEIAERNATFYDFVDPRLIYSNSNLGEIHEGLCFKITGILLQTCERFSINFILNTPDRDIALHINPRLPLNYIVRNCKVKGIWGKEENSSSCPFTLKRGKHFSMQILITEEEFYISLNNQHYATFQHRLPFRQIVCLEIKGDIDNVDVQRSIVSKYPDITPETEPKLIEYSSKSKATDTDCNGECNSESKTKLLTTTTSIPSLISSCFNNSLGAIKKGYTSQIVNGVCEKSLELPFCGKLPHKFVPGSLIRIFGRVKILPASFFINLQSDHITWPHPIIAFHFNPRYANLGGNHVIVCNSWHDGKWDMEQRSPLNKDLEPGITFTLFIYCGEKSYEVYLNTDLILEYAYKVKPDVVDTILIRGDIKLWEVTLEKDVLNELNKDNPSYMNYFHAVEDKKE